VGHASVAFDGVGPEQKIYGTIEAWRNRPIKGDHHYVYLDGIVLKRSLIGWYRPDQGRGLHRCHRRRPDRPVHLEPACCCMCDLRSRDGTTLRRVTAANRGRCTGEHCGRESGISNSSDLFRIQGLLEKSRPDRRHIAVARQKVTWLLFIALGATDEHERAYD
jgi:hypothetical protein